MRSSEIFGVRMCSPGLLNSLLMRLALAGEGDGGSMRTSSSTSRTAGCSGVPLGLGACVSGVAERERGGVEVEKQCGSCRAYSGST